MFVNRLAINLSAVVHALIVYYTHDGTVMTRKCVDRVVDYAKCTEGEHAGCAALCSS